MNRRPTVSIIRCDARAKDEVVAEKLEEAASQIPDLGRLFAGKRKVFLKPNLGTAEVRWHEGRQVALTDKSVVRATVALIRKYFAGEIVLSDDTTVDATVAEVYRQVGYDAALAPYDVRLVDLHRPPYVELKVPGTPLMFTKYRYSAELADADAVVSISTMKSHLSTGATLTLKNLFGLTPIQVYGAPRRYLHAPIRLPRALADGGRILRPILNVIDGLIGQDDREWGGPPVKTDVLLIGDNTIATDAIAMRLMGMDPTLDYPRFPYHFDRNPLLLASQMGLGPVKADEIDIRGQAPTEPIFRFHVGREESESVDLVRRSVAQQALVYLEKRSQLLSKYREKIIALADGQVLAAVDTVDEVPHRAELAGALRGSPTAGIFLKQVLPPEEETERMEVYQQVLDGTEFEAALNPPE